MRRIGLAVVLALSLAAPLAADAQQTRKMPRIGVLAVGIPTMYTARYEAFRQGLRELGYIEGQTVAIEYRYAEGKSERLAELAAEWSAPHFDCSPWGRKLRREVPWASTGGRQTADGCLRQSSSEQQSNGL